MAMSIQCERRSWPGSPKGDRGPVAPLFAETLTKCAEAYIEACADGFIPTRGP
jgi:hypothetical protein